MTTLPRKISTVSGEVNISPRRRSLKTKILEKYDEIADRFPQFALRRGFTENSPAEQEYISWYLQERKNQVRTGERSGERMERHGIWHLKTALLAREKETQGQVA